MLLIFSSFFKGCCGKDVVEIQSIDLEHVTINVEKLKDGKFNFQYLMHPPKIVSKNNEPAPNAKKFLLSRLCLHLIHARVTNIGDDEKSESIVLDTFLWRGVKLDDSNEFVETPLTMHDLTASIQSKIVQEVLSSNVSSVASLALQHVAGHQKGCVIKHKLNSRLPR